MIRLKQILSKIIIAQCVIYYFLFAQFIDYQEYDRENYEHYFDRAKSLKDETSFVQYAEDLHQSIKSEWENTLYWELYDQAVQRYIHDHSSSPDNEVTEHIKDELSSMLVGWESELICDINKTHGVFTAIHSGFDTGSLVNASGTALQNDLRLLGNLQISNYNSDLQLWGEMAEQLITSNRAYYNSRIDAYSSALKSNITDLDSEAMSACLQEIDRFSMSAGYDLLKVTEMIYTLSKNQYYKNRKNLADKEAGTSSQWTNLLSEINQKLQEIELDYSNQSGLIDYQDSNYSAEGLAADYLSAVSNSLFSYLSNINSVIDHQIEPADLPQFNISSLRDDYKDELMALIESGFSGWKDAESALSNAWQEWMAAAQADYVSGTNIWNDTLGYFNAQFADWRDRLDYRIAEGYLSWQDTLDGASNSYYQAQQDLAQVLEMQEISLIEYLEGISSDLDFLYGLSFSEAESARQTFSNLLVNDILSGHYIPKLLKSDPVHPTRLEEAFSIPVWEAAGIYNSGVSSLDLKLFLQEPVTATVAGLSDVSNFISTIHKYTFELSNDTVFIMKNPVEDTLSGAARYFSDSNQVLYTGEYNFKWQLFERKIETNGTYYLTYKLQTNYFNISAIITQAVYTNYVYVSNLYFTRTVNTWGYGRWLDFDTAFGHIWPSMLEEFLGGMNYYRDHLLIMESCADEIAKIKNLTAQAQSNSDLLASGLLEEIYKNLLGQESGAGIFSQNGINDRFYFMSEDEIQLQLNQIALKKIQSRYLVNNFLLQYLNEGYDGTVISILSQTAAVLSDEAFQSLDRYLLQKGSTDFLLTNTLAALNNSLSLLQINVDNSFSNMNYYQSLYQQLAVGITPDDVNVSAIGYPSAAFSAYQAAYDQYLLAKNNYQSQISALGDMRQEHNLQLSNFEFQYNLSIALFDQYQDKYSEFRMTNDIFLGLSYADYIDVNRLSNDHITLAEGYTLISAANSNIQNSIIQKNLIDTDTLVFIDDFLNAQHSQIENIRAAQLSGNYPQLQLNITDLRSEAVLFYNQLLTVEQPFNERAALNRISSFYYTAMTNELNSSGYTPLFLTAAEILNNLFSTAFHLQKQKEEALQSAADEIKYEGIYEQYSNWDIMINEIAANMQNEWSEAGIQIEDSFTAWKKGYSNALSEGEALWLEKNNELNARKKLWIEYTSLLLEQEQKKAFLSELENSTAEMIASAFEDLPSYVEHNMKDRDEALKRIDELAKMEFSSQLVHYSSGIDTVFSTENVGIFTFYRDESLRQEIISDMEALEDSALRAQNYAMYNTLFEQAISMTESINNYDDSTARQMNEMYQTRGYTYKGTYYTRRIVSDSTLLGGDDYTEQTAAAYQEFPEVNIQLKIDATYILGADQFLVSSLLQQESARLTEVYQAYMGSDYLREYNEAEFYRTSLLFGHIGKANEYGSKLDNSGKLPVIAWGYSQMKDIIHDITLNDIEKSKGEAAKNRPVWQKKIFDYNDLKNLSLNNFQNNSPFMKVFSVLPLGRSLSFISTLGEASMNRFSGSKIESRVEKAFDKIDDHLTLKNLALTTVSAAMSAGTVGVGTGAAVMFMLGTADALGTKAYYGDQVSWNDTYKQIGVSALTSTLGLVSFGAGNTVLQKISSSLIRSAFNSAGNYAIINGIDVIDNLSHNKEDLRKLRFDNMKKTYNKARAGTTSFSWGNLSQSMLTAGLGQFIGTKGPQSAFGNIYRMGLSKAASAMAFSAGHFVDGGSADELRRANGWDMIGGININLAKVNGGRDNNGQPIKDKYGDTGLAALVIDKNGAGLKFGYEAGTGDVSFKDLSSTLKMSALYTKSVIISISDPFASHLPFGRSTTPEKDDIQSNSLFSRLFRRNREDENGLDMIELEPEDIQDIAFNMSAEDAPEQLTAQRAEEMEMISMLDDRGEGDSEIAMGDSQSQALGSENEGQSGDDRYYSVKKGDNYTKIAKAELAKQGIKNPSNDQLNSKINELEKLNGKKLIAGTTIRTREDTTAEYLNDQLKVVSDYLVDKASLGKRLAISLYRNLTTTEKEKFITTAILTENHKLSAQETKYILDYLSASANDKSYSAIQDVITEQFNCFNTVHPEAGEKRINDVKEYFDWYLSGDDTKLESQGINLQSTLNEVKEFIDKDFSADSGYEFNFDEYGQFLIKEFGVKNWPITEHPIYPSDRYNYTAPNGNIYFRNYSADYLFSTDNLSFFNISFSNYLKTNENNN